MAEGVVFHYRDADTPLHRLDPRVKLLSLAAVSIAIVLIPPGALIIIGAFSLVLALAAQLPVSSFSRELRVFLFLGGIIFAGRCISGDISEAISAAGRFFTIVIMGLVLMDTTAADDSAAALYWFLALFSRRFAGRSAAKLMLTLSFIPLIFDSITEVREARRARQERPARHPLRFLLSFLIQTFDIMLVKAEEISLALEAREFKNSVHPRTLHFKPTDIIALAVTAGVIFVSAAV